MNQKEPSSAQVKKIEMIFNILKNYSEDVKPVSNKSIRLVAAITHKYNVISLGCAKRKTHPMQAKYSETENHVFLHAEIDAMQRAIRLDKIELWKCELFVLRVKQWKESDCNRFIQGWGNARPCEGCQGAIRAFGIKEIYHTEDSKNKLIWSKETF